LPRPVQRIGLFLPATYVVNGLQQTIVNSATAWSRYAEILSLAVWAASRFSCLLNSFGGSRKPGLPVGQSCLVAATGDSISPSSIVRTGGSHSSLEAKSAFLSMTSPMSVLKRRCRFPQQAPTGEKPPDLDPK